MSDHLYCLTSPSFPGIVRIGAVPYDPHTRRSLAGLVSSRRHHDIAWTLKVVDGDAALAALTDAMQPFADSAWQGGYRCDPMRARAHAVRFTSLREYREEEEDDTASLADDDLLPACVLSLGVAVQCLHFVQGNLAPSLALTAAALFWVAHQVPKLRLGRSAA